MYDPAFYLKPCEVVSEKTYSREINIAQSMKLTFVVYYFFWKTLGQSDLPRQIPRSNVTRDREEDCYNNKKYSK